MVPRDIETEFRVWVKMFGEDQAEQLRYEVERYEAEHAEARQPDAPLMMLAPQLAEWGYGKDDWNEIANALEAEGIEVELVPDKRVWAAAEIVQVVAAVIYVAAVTDSLLSTIERLIRAGKWVTARNERRLQGHIRVVEIYGPDGEVVKTIELPALEPEPEAEPGIVLPAQTNAGSGEVKSQERWWKRVWRHSSKAVKVAAAVAAGICALYGATMIVLHIVDRPEKCNHTFNRSPDPDTNARTYRVDTQATGLSCVDARVAIEDFERDVSTYVYPAKTDRYVPYYGVSPEFLLAPQLKEGQIDLTCKFTPHGLGGTEHTVRCEGNDDVALNWTTFQN